VFEDLERELTAKILTPQSPLVRPFVPVLMVGLQEHSAVRSIWWTPAWLNKHQSLAFLGSNFVIP
jgi:hypothetical protein